MMVEDLFIGYRLFEVPGAAGVKLLVRVQVFKKTFFQSR
jgi:hypothetical protein